jgi:alkylated DNA nucleotide flippase Atl1
MWGMPPVSTSPSLASHWGIRAGKGRSGIPWYRVVNAQVRISPRSCGSDADTEQRLRLEHEGVSFDAGGVSPSSGFYGVYSLQKERIQRDRLLKWQSTLKISLYPFSHRTIGNGKYHD